MLVVPAAVPVATPEVLITAFVTSEEVHVTCDVRFNVEPSLKLPVAVNSWVLPTPRGGGAAGVTAIDVRVAAVTLRVAVPTTPPNAAVMAAGEPTDDSPVARPVLLMVATVAGVDAQVTKEVRGWLPSPNTPVAVKFVDMVSGTVADKGVTLMACNGLASTMTFAVLGGGRHTLR